VNDARLSTVNTTHMIQSNQFQLEQEVPWEDMGNGIQRQVYGYNKAIMLVKAKFEKAAIGALHQHPHTQVTYVESGVFEMTIGDQKKIISEGDGFYVAPNVLHGCVCLEPGMLVDAFSPLREDILNSIATRS
jgi:quercetin dioxygenase-like cupin family protein